MSTRKKITRSTGVSGKAITPDRAQVVLRPVPEPVATSTTPAPEPIAMDMASGPDHSMMVISTPNNSEEYTVAALARLISENGVNRAPSLADRLGARMQETSRAFRNFGAMFNGGFTEGGIVPVASDPAVQLRRAETVITGMRINTDHDDALRYMLAQRPSVQSLASTRPAPEAAAEETRAGFHAARAGLDAAFARARDNIDIDVLTAQLRRGLSDRLMPMTVQPRTPTDPRSILDRVRETLARIFPGCSDMRISSFNTNDGPRYIALVRTTLSDNDTVCLLARDCRVVERFTTRENPAEIATVLGEFLLNCGLFS